MKNLLLILICVMLSNYSSGQERETEYFKLVSLADSLFKTKNYKMAAIKYSTAFMINGDKGLIEHRYDAACAWALSNNPDSSFSQLIRIAEKANYDDYEHISTDPDLQSLHSDKRWNQLMDIVRKNNNKVKNN